MRFGHVRWAGSALLVAALARACAGGSGAARTSTPAASAGAVAPALEDLDVQPVEHQEESVALAFDAESAAELLQTVPADLDFAARSVVCVFLGPRQTTGWSLDLRTASLSDGVLAIRARETAPRTGTRPEVTYPADCALIDRAALPTGELTVRSDDTITGEFIAETTIDVPEAPTSP